eukprot:TRINITY_DN6709_c0_g1_i1.p3 TRINITY_DN6709_c0_g1~~TRINITY_DN6709_c0_g1_i1.p3  ORF type:complete len:206 (+),score=4.43 TRINITY_DN6709_c0_g1_i1:2271-2888(+)
MALGIGVSSVVSCDVAVGPGIGTDGLGLRVALGDTAGGTAPRQELLPAKSSRRPWRAFPEGSAWASASLAADNALTSPADFGSALATGKDTNAESHPGAMEMTPTDDEGRDDVGMSEVPVSSSLVPISPPPSGGASFHNKGGPEVLASRHVRAIEGGAFMVVCSLAVVFDMDRRGVCMSAGGRSAVDMGTASAIRAREPESPAAG